MVRVSGPELFLGFLTFFPEFRQDWPYKQSSAHKNPGFMAPSLILLVKIQFCLQIFGVSGLIETPVRKWLKSPRL